MKLSTHTQHRQLKVKSTVNTLHSQAIVKLYLWSVQSKQDWYQSFNIAHHKILIASSIKIGLLKVNWPI